MHRAVVEYLSVVSTHDQLPKDTESLHRLLIDARQSIAQRDEQLRLAEAKILYSTLEIENLKMQLARLRRMQFGRSSEKLSEAIEQIEFKLEELETGVSANEPAAVSAPRPARPPRKPFPATFPRQIIPHDIGCTCPDCGRQMRRVGEDSAEMLEWVPGRLKVLKHVRAKYSCSSCQTLVQAPAPSRPIPRSFAGPGFIAHVLTSKFADHIPLYRQSRIYAREGLDIERSTLADIAGGAYRQIDPLLVALGRSVLAPGKLHADDTPLPVLAPGRGKTKTGRLWTYVRDDRPSGSTDPPAVLFRYSPDRKGERPRGHLRDFHGYLQADAYGGFRELYRADRAAGRILEIACWAHARRGVYEVWVAQKSPIAQVILERIKVLYAIEDQVRGQSATQRQAARQVHSVPKLEELKRYLETALSSLSRKCALAKAIRYCLVRWPALTRYTSDGSLEIDNSAAERALRTVALGRHNFLFAGSDAGGERAAGMYSLIGTCLLNGIDPEAYLRYVFERIADHPVNRIAELLPWDVAPHLTDPIAVAA
jgi:transposase